ncbi:MAG: UDP-glucose--hexose-1-phosphate uridylyltransferase [Bryobacterales bacterium]
MSVSDLNLFNEYPHRRRNALTGEWVLVSPHRTKRPWQGQRDRPAQAALAAYDPGCYLCPGNERAGGGRNPNYASTYVFDNDFPALMPEIPDSAPREDGLLEAHLEKGLCRVVCFSPRHDLTLARMASADIRPVVDTWIAQDAEISARPEIGYVQIFENRGAMMGCSNAHPHGQIWSTEHVPEEPAKELRAQAAHFERTARPLLDEYLEHELAAGERVVCTNETFVAVAPFWAVWPFETLILPRRPFARWGQMNEAERDGLSAILHSVTVRYDNLFETSFPYSMGFHPAPADEQEHPEWVFHAHFFPPLLRSAEVRKFMVGFEMLGTPQRDITPEQAAARLRDLPETHYASAASAAGTPSRNDG